MTDVPEGSRAIPDLDHPSIEDLRRSAERLLQAEERARERIPDRPAGHWYFALVGFAMEPPSGLSFGPAGHIQPVVEPPGEVALARTLLDKSLFGAVGRYMPTLTAELVVSKHLAAEPHDAANFGWTLIAAMRLRTGAEFLAPAMADHSWDTIAGLPHDTCWVHMLEDIPRARRTREEHIRVTQLDADWIFDNSTKILQLRADRNFQFALECLSGSHVETDRRMAIAKTWSGIEAIVGISQELTFRLATYLAALLEPLGPQRRERYHLVREMYRTRSAVVHGQHLADARTRQHLHESRTLLSECLTRLVELGRFPDTDDYEKLIFEDHQAATGNGPDRGQDQESSPPDSPHSAL